MNTDLIVRFIQNIRVHLCPSVVYKYTNLACSTLGRPQELIILSDAHASVADDTEVIPPKSKKQIQRP